MKRFWPLFLALSLISSVPVAIAQNIDQLFQKGNAAQDAGDFIEAERIFRKIIQINPKEARAYDKIARALYEQKKLDEAIINIRKAIQLNADFYEAYSHLGIILSDQNKLEEAITAYKKAIQFKPGYANAYIGLGNALYAQKKYEEAITAYRKAIQLKPNDSEAYYNLGVALYKQEKYNEAIAAYRKAIQLEPDDADAYVNLGSALDDQEKYEEAITAYKKAIQLKPNNSDAYHNLGVALKNLGKLEEAIAAYTKAIQLKPNNAIAYGSLGLLLYGQNKYNEATIAFKKALTLSEEMGTLTNSHAFARNGLGRIFQEQNKLEEAIDEFQKAVAIDPQYAFAQNNLKEVQRLLALRQKTIVIDDVRYLPSVKDEPLVKELRSTPRIILEGSLEGTITGAGWVVKREGDSIWVVTNRHIISNQRFNRIVNEIWIEFFAELPPNVKRARYSATIVNIAKPDEIDLAVLKVTGVPKDIQPLVMQPGRISRNTKVIVIGHPLNVNDWSSISGETMNFSEQNPKLHIGNTIIAEGNSGGPVLNSQNQLIGMIFGISNEGDISPETSAKINLKQASPATGKVGLAYRIDIVMAKLREWKILN